MGGFDLIKSKINSFTIRYRLIVTITLFVVNLTTVIEMSYESHKRF